MSVGDKMFFVDPIIFSRNSDYFRILIGNKCFLEGTIGLLQIKDESPKDIHTLVSVISPNVLGLYPTPIDGLKIVTT